MNGKDFLAAIELVLRLGAEKSGIYCRNVLRATYLGFKRSVLTIYGL